MYDYLLQLSPGNFVCVITFYFYHGFKFSCIPTVNISKIVLKAYLSLPEGAASSAGLIAMMTDHYNILVSYYLFQVFFLYVQILDLNDDSSYNLLQEESKSNDDDESSKEIAGSGPSNQILSRSRRNTSAAIQPGNNSKLTPQVSVGMLNYAVPSPAKKPRTIAGRYLFPLIALSSFSLAWENKFDCDLQLIVPDLLGRGHLGSHGR